MERRPARENFVSGSDRGEVVAGLAIQFALAFILLRFPPAVALFDAFAAGVTKVISFADEGTRFIFGNAADAGGATAVE